MHYVIHCLDHDGAIQTRLDNYEAHKAYLASAPVKTVISGPLLADDEETMIGSCFVLEAESLAEVEEFNRNDPFARVGLWKTVSIPAFRASIGFSKCTGLPSKITSPRVRVSTPVIWRTKVLLPAPLSPMIATCSPRCRVKFAPSSACTPP